MIKKLFAVVFFTSMLFLGATSAYASGNEKCGPSKRDFDKLESVKNDYSLDYVDEIKMELQLRKKILGDVLGCAVQEAATLKTNVDGIGLEDRDSINLQSQFANQLDNAINYYRTEQAKIDDLGLQGSKDFAKNLELWRGGNYTQVSEMATNFLIWGKNQKILETAKARVDQIGRNVTLLSLVYNEEIKDLWKEVDINFSEAKKFNEQAKNDLGFRTPDDALAHIKSSLDSLSKTYEKLSDLVSAINKAFAIPS